MAGIAESMAVEVLQSDLAQVTVHIRAFLGGVNKSIWRLERLGFRAIQGLGTDGQRQSGQKRMNQSSRKIQKYTPARQKGSQAGEWRGVEERSFATSRTWKEICQKVGCTSHCLLFLPLSGLNNSRLSDQCQKKKKKSSILELVHAELLLRRGQNK